MLPLSTVQIHHETKLQSQGSHHDMKVTKAYHAGYVAVQEKQDLKEPEPEVSL